MIRKLPFNFILFTIYPVIFLYAHNVDKVSFTVVAKTALLLLVLSTGIFLLIFGLCKDVYKTASLLSFSLFFFFLYGHVAVFSPSIFIETPFGVINKNYLLLPIWFLGVASILITVFKIPPKVLSLSYFLNVLGCLLIATNVVPIGRHFLSVSQKDFNKDVFEPSTLSKENLRDIYYIILDGHARGDVLKDMYQYDNKKFVEELRNLGFYVADRSRSNYTQTYLSVASTLNMKYVNYLSEELGEKSDNRNPLASLINDNVVISILRQFGYKIVTFESGWSGTENLKSADSIVRSKYGFSEFQNVLLSFTPLAYVGAEDFRYDLHRWTIRNAFNQLPQIALISDPTFTYAHILSPHPPFVFDKDGTDIKQKAPFSLNDPTWKYLYDRSSSDYKAFYVGQVEFIDNAITNTLERIIENSSKSPIIILQADHGPASIYISENPSIEGVKERTAILNAYYFPEIDENNLYSTISPVNTFRLLFSKYFRKDVSLIEDEVFVSPFERPYDFVNVTNELDFFEAKNNDG